MTMSKRLKGFTLIEILVVVGLIAILAAITIVAINPAKNFADTRDTQRSSDVTQILNAVTQYTSEKGNVLSGLGTIPICTTSTSAIGTGVGAVDLGSNLVDEFIAAIPMDPTSGTAADTGYTICRSTGNRVTITGTGENAGTITVTR